jgi:hypothetical protein
MDFVRPPTLMKTQLHHKIPRSRGGTNDAWNLVELSEYEHAHEHALDFILFNASPMFDFRQKGWKLLPKDLQLAVKAEMKNRITGLHLLHKEKLPDGRSKKGVENVKKLHKVKISDGRSLVAYNSKIKYRKPIFLIHSITGEKLWFESIQTAALKINAPATNICKVLLGKRKTVKNFFAQYALS